MVVFWNSSLRVVLSGCSDIEGDMSEVIITKLLLVQIEHHHCLHFVNTISFVLCRDVGGNSLSGEGYKGRPGCSDRMDKEYQI